ncbi:PAS domain-containing protein [Solwaraspora sp. WMMD406]|uniref:PAS domain-containing protein n=1 Tax=Solwaraspora sp. WMMD406 TaxID=3016095 RepID=UPI002415A863|nr:PAS domain-containing protein [Solwaraspora sp. WMMD406]MDG4768073.1 PAS domain-containing protein [Solwaraspora sp. WMMD406]
MPRRVLTGYLVVLACLGVAVFAVRAGAALWWGLTGVASVAAMVWGIHHHRPPRRVPWLLLAGGVAVLAVGDVCYELSPRFTDTSLGLLAEGLYLVNFGLLAAGVLILTRTSVALRDRAGLLDTLILFLVAGLVTWTLVVGPALVSVDLPTAAKVLLSLQSLGGVLVVVVMLRLAAAAWRDPSVLLLAIGAASLLLADLYYTVAQLGDGWRPGILAELGWFTFYLTWGAAGLHHSMARLATPARPSADEIAAMRVSMVTLTCLTVPVLLLFRAFLGGPSDLAVDLVIAAVTALTMVLAVIRFTDSVLGHRRAIRREQSLRESGALLLSATTVEEVAAAIRRSVARLLPVDSAYQLLFAVCRPAAEAGVALAGPTGWRPQIVVDHALPVGGVGAERRSRLMPTRLLHPDLVDLLTPAPATLMVSLAAPVPSAGSGVVLLVAAENGVLAASRDAVEVVAGQAVSAVHRMAVAEEAALRDRDRYLDLIAGTAGEAVMIVGSDDRIRYASSPCGPLLGVDLQVLADWRDLIHPDDHAQVARTLADASERGAGRAVGAQWILRRPDGSHVLLEVRCRDLRQVQGVRGLVLNLRDVAALRRRESESARRRLDGSAPGQNRRSLRQRFR